MKQNPSRKVKPLTLHRETLCQLGDRDLPKVAGGIALPHTYTTCGTFLCHTQTC